MTHVREQRPRDPTHTAVVVPDRRPSRRGSVVASLELTDQVRAAAGVDVAAVLVTRSLPVDIRHASKVDRAQVQRAAARVLAGGRAVDGA